MAEGRALTAAYRTAYAMADGKALQREYERWQSSLRVPPHGQPVELTPDDERTIAYIVGQWTRTPTEVS